MRGAGGIPHRQGFDKGLHSHCLVPELETRLISITRLSWIVAGFH